MSPLLALFGSDCSDPQCLLMGEDRKSVFRAVRTAFDPTVWTGRALQVDFAELAVSGLASMYPAFDWWHLLAG